MQDYSAPLKDIRFVMRELARLDEICALPAFADIDAETVDAVLEEGAKLAREVLSPLNAAGDREGTRVEDKGVIQAGGYQEAYDQYVAGGWSTLSCGAEFGGTGMPDLVAAAVSEMWASANLSFSICPMLSIGAIGAISKHASDELKKRYLPPLVSGQWTGTMNLTEPQAGSDLAAIRTKATPEGDHYRISGTKIFISWGDHQMTDNIVHLVLARTPDAPEGVKGISMFVVPKFLLNDDGSVGERNDLVCASVEHKMGIHASPTCVMNYGENGGAIGYLVGEENRGLKYMFTMMNNARLHVGIEGVALGERSCQLAADYARERVQGVALGAAKAGPIIEHGDVRRMLLQMKALTEAARAINYVASAALDRADHGDDDAQRRVEFLTPIAKGWATEVCQEVTSLGLQVHGGMGYIEETGAAQLFRDARIITIYEGTTGIQALDLVGRKILRDGGKELMNVMQEIQSTIDNLSADEELASIGAELQNALDSWSATSTELGERVIEDMQLVSTAAVNFLMLAGTVTGGWLLGKSALIAQSKMDEDPDFYRAKIATAMFFSAHILPRAGSFAKAALADSSLVNKLSDEQF